jgi:CRP-like cAMP-binding protein
MNQMLRPTQAESPAISANEVLASLPRAALDYLKPRLALATFTASTIVQESRKAIEHVYFPTSGLASLQIITGSGIAIDTALIGRDSILGPMAIMESARASSRCVARTTMLAWRTSASDLRDAAEKHGEILAACIEYNDKLLHQTQISAARYSLCRVDVRLALLLMEASHLLGDAMVPLSQEIISDIMAVRRTSVTEAAGALKSAGAIEYARAKITVKDRSALFKFSRQA